MPLELGLFLGAKKFGTGKQKEKICIILDKKPYRYKEFISDIGGQDIKAHKGIISNCIKEIRDGLNNSTERKTIPGGKEILRRYKLFNKDLPGICASLKVELDELTYVDYTNIIPVWIEDFEE